MSTLHDAVSIAGCVAHRIEQREVAPDINELHGVYGFLACWCARSIREGRALGQRYLNAERADGDEMIRLVRNRRRRDAAKAAARARTA